MTHSFRSILTTPWVELVGKCSVKCEKTGYYAEVEFLAKVSKLLVRLYRVLLQTFSWLQPFYGGRAHCIKADAYRPVHSSSSSVNKNPYLSVRGQWNGVMHRKTAQGVRSIPFSAYILQSLSSTSDGRGFLGRLSITDSEKASESRSGTGRL